MHCTVHNKKMVRLGENHVCYPCLAEGSTEAIEMVESLRTRMSDTEFCRRLNDASIPSGFIGAGFDNFVAASPHAEKVAKVLAAYCAAFEAQRLKRSGFLFTGATGTGKTHLACAMVLALIECGFRAVYASLPRFTGELRASFGRFGAADALLARLANADFLVLDEIDLHGSSDNDYNTLYDIINARYEKDGRPTLAITNRTAERLTIDLDERLVSRILGGTKPITFDWPSRREVRISQRRGGPADVTKGAQ